MQASPSYNTKTAFPPSPHIKPASPTTSPDIGPALPTLIKPFSPLTHTSDQPGDFGTVVQIIESLERSVCPHFVNAGR